MQYVNLTPHRVTVTPGGAGTPATIDVEPSGVVARVETKVILTDELGHERVSYGRITGLPDGEPTDDQIDDYDNPTMWIVSLVTLLAAQASKHPWRGFLLAPWQEIRDESGRIVGCRGLHTVSR
jgi:hypothetical protein